MSRSTSDAQEVKDIFGLLGVQVRDSLGIYKTTTCPWRGYLTTSQIWNLDDAPSYYS